MSVRKIQAERRGARHFDDHHRLPRKEQTALAKKIMAHYLDRGLISEPLTAADKTFLEKLNKLWHDRPTIGCMLARVPEKERALLPDTWMLTRAER